MTIFRERAPLGWVVPAGFFRKCLQRNDLHPRGGPPRSPKPLRSNDLRRFVKNTEVKG